MTPPISNLKKSIEEGVAFSSKLATVWTSSPVAQKEKLQKLIFPEGVIYSKKTGAFRTMKVNSFFVLIAEAAQLSKENKKGTNKLVPCLSPSAEREGFEPPDLVSQRFSRPPHSTALPSLRRKNRGAILINKIEFHIVRKNGGVIAACHQLSRHCK